MEGLLPAIFESLKQRGWDINKEPLIGIGQAFGGPLNRYYVIPDAKDIATQSKSFCEHGATGFGPTAQTPMNSPEIATGIQRGIVACKGIWRS
jgi:hypothetical protein